MGRNGIKPYEMRRFAHDLLKDLGVKMSLDKERIYEVGTERVNLLTDFVCGVYGLSYLELADKIGVYRPHFARMLNAGLNGWGVNTLFKVVDLAAQVDSHMLMAWIFDEQDANGPTQGDISPDNEQIG